MDVTFFGVRGSIASPGAETARVGGNTSTIEVRCGDRRIVLDAGTGLRALGQRMLAAGDERKLTLLLSHYHWDHIQGLPFFTPIYMPGTEIEVVGQKSGLLGVRDALELQMGAPVFPVRFGDLPSRIVPIFNTPLGKSAEVEGERLMLTDWVSCCSDLRMRPIMEYIEAEAFPPLIHGQRRSDNTRGFQINMPRNLACIGVIWEWTDADVWGYIERNGLRLPMQYPELASSFECWNCPASMNPGMYQFLQRHYPERAREYAGILAEVYQTVTREQERIAPMLRAAQGDSSLTRSALPCGGVSFESS